MGTGFGEKGMCGGDGQEPAGPDVHAPGPSVRCSCSGPHSLHLWYTIGTHYVLRDKETQKPQRLGMGLVPREVLEGSIWSGKVSSLRKT